MINNTARQRWQRAEARHLDAQFLAEIEYGMNCSRFEAEAILAKVHAVYDPVWEGGTRLNPGQVQLMVVDASVALHIPLAQAQQRLVILTLDVGAADLAIRRQGGVTALRRHRLARITEEAFQQGGLLTLEGIADLFNCAVRTLVSDLAALRAAGQVLPLRSTVKDMGRAITHRRLIITEWLAGREYSAIAAHTHHSLAAVANYIEKYKRCVALLREFDLETTAFLAQVSLPLARAFQDIAASSTPLASRQAELDTYAKKHVPTTAERRPR
ncbi:MAG: DUF1670 domain-containing protein [Armatimonadota bacterium]